MVKKPSEGICAVCGSANLRFFDDGTGVCPDCERKFRWASLDEIEAIVADERKKSEKKEEGEKQGSETDERSGGREGSSYYKETSERPSVSERRYSRTNGFHPAEPPASATSEEPSYGYLWITIFGFIILIIGFVIHALTMTNIDINSGMMKNLDAFSFLCRSIGVSTASIGLIIGGVKAENLDDRTKMGMFIAAGLIIGLALFGF
ncbi:MAG: hypothetical protein R6U61_05995 [Thermoplasmata archaeon]